MIHDICQKRGHFGYYVMRLWILFEPSVLAVFFLIQLWQKKGEHCLYCQVGVEVLVLHLTLVDIQGGVFLIIAEQEDDLWLPIRSLLIPPCWGRGRSALLLLLTCLCWHHERSVFLPRDNGKGPDSLLVFLWHRPSGEWGNLVIAGWSWVSRFPTWSPPT